MQVKNKPKAMRVRTRPAAALDIGSYADKTYTLPAQVTHGNAPAVAQALLEALELPLLKRGSAVALSPEQMQRPGQGGNLEEPMPALRMTAPSAPCMVLDASALRKFDSSLLPALMQLHRKAAGLVQIQHAPAQLLALVQVYGLEEVMPTMHLRAEDVEK